MNRTITSLLVSAVLLSASALTAQTATSNTTAPRRATVRQRQIEQQKRIGEGVENGSLTAGEAAKLEKQESKLNKEVKEMREDNGGKLTPAERARVQRQQNRLSREIYHEKHDAQVQPPAKGEVNTRERNQQKRIGEGIENGSLTPAEAARLEKKEAAVNHEVKDMREDNGGKLTPAERRKVNRQQNRLSRQIYRQKHDAQHR